MMASKLCSFGALNGLINSTNNQRHPPNSFLSFPRFSRTNFVLKTPRLRIWQRRIPSRQLFGVPIVSCLAEDNSVVYPESGKSPFLSDSQKDASIDIRLPRRSLLVKFTCNACGSRSERFVNKLAYERGTVFVQCSGCFQHHKLVDNLGLVVEYDFREEIDAD